MLLFCYFCFCPYMTLVSVLIEQMQLLQSQQTKNHGTGSTRVVDPDPHGSAFIFPPGSGSRRVNLSTKN